MSKLKNFEQCKFSVKAILCGDILMIIIITSLFVVTQTCRKMVAIGMSTCVFIKKYPSHWTILMTTSQVTIWIIRWLCNSDDILKSQFLCSVFTFFLRLNFCIGVTEIISFFVFFLKTTFSIFLQFYFRSTM